MLIGIVLAAALAQDAIDYRLLKGPDYVVFEDGITPRARVRANYYTKDRNDQWGNSPGQISIEYGLPVWKAEYDALFEKMPTGKRWRLGSNYWTNLASTLPFEISGKQVKSGYYFLVMEHTQPDLWSLILLDPAEVTRRQMDPYHVNSRDSGPGISLPLKWERVDKTADKLAISLKLNDTNPKEMVIHINFGKHHFQTAALTMRF
jgi:hypothetical protein